MSVAAPLILRPGDEPKLRAPRLCPPADRARIVLLAAEGPPNAAIARQAGVSPDGHRPAGRHESGGIAALDELERSGHPPETDDVAVVVATLEGRPDRWQ